MNLKEFIRDVPDFPKAGILFRDITPLLGARDAFRHAIDELAGIIKTIRPSAIAAIESRGFIFGAPVAVRLGLPFVPIRKPGKLPAKTYSTEYGLEYGSDKLEMHTDAIPQGAKVAIVDDLLATGGTAQAAAKLIELCGGKIVGYAFLIELEALKGRTLLPAPVHSVLQY